MNWGIAMTEEKFENQQLDDLFREERELSQYPPADLMSRVLADALGTQADFSPPPRPTRRAFWQDLFRVLGGWPSMAGLATATVAGVWLGAFPPEALPSAADAYLGLSDAGYLIDTAPGLGFDLVEEIL